MEVKNNMISLARYIQTIDTHTVGQPTRVVTNGIPTIEGNSIFEKSSI